MPWNYTGAEAVIMWIMFGACAYLIIPIVLCWALFAVAWCKGWRDPRLTPADIIKRLGRGP